MKILASKFGDSDHKAKAQREGFKGFAEIVMNKV